jgi:hypothetical protein
MKVVGIYILYVVSAYAAIHEYINNHGGEDNMEVIFLYGRKSATMKLKDMKALDEERGRLTSNLMNWFCTWYSTQLIDVDIIFSTTEISTILKVDIQIDGEALGVLKKFYKKKSRLWDEAGTIVVIPIGGNWHWNVVVVLDKYFLVFDSSNNKFFYGTEKLLKCIAKVWTIHVGHVVRSEMWLKITASLGMLYWRHVRVP